MARFKIHRKDSSPLVSLLRTTGVIIVFFITGLLFWKNYESTIEKITSRQTIYDQTRTLSKSEKKILMNFARYLKDLYGVELKININKKHIVEPDNLSKTLFIGICPLKKEAVIYFPVLLKKSLPLEFTNYMETKYCREYLEKDSWPIGLINGVKLIFDQLNKLDNEYNKQ
ncbi:hypothetical protein JCM13304A_21180 [Desulfothermus okinawensis JCM 13304]